MLLSMVVEGGDMGERPPTVQYFGENISPTEIEAFSSFSRHVYISFVFQHFQNKIADMRGDVKLLDSGEDVKDVYRYGHLNRSPSPPPSKFRCEALLLSK